MVRGRFKRFEHDHYFIERASQTLMRDVIEFASPLGLVGRVVDLAFLNAYLRNLIIQRNCVIKEAAEAGRRPSNSEMQRTKPAQATELRR